MSDVTLQFSIPARLPIPPHLRKEHADLNRSTRTRTRKIGFGDRRVTAYTMLLRMDTPMPEAGIEPTCSTQLQRVYSPLPIHLAAPALLGMRSFNGCDKKKERVPHALRWSGPLIRKSLL